MNMKSSNLVWVGIRLLGVFFLVEASIYLVEFVFAFYSIYGQGVVEWGTNTGNQFEQMLMVGGRLLAIIAIYLLSGLYCLFGGKGLHSRIIGVFESEDT